MNGRVRVGLAMAGMLACGPGAAEAQSIQDLGRGLLNQLAPQGPQGPQGRGNDSDAYERGRRDAEEQRRRDDDRRRSEQNDYRRNDDRRRLDLDRRPYDTNQNGYDRGDNRGGYDNRGDSRGGGYNGQPQQRY